MQVQAGTASALRVETAVEIDALDRLVSEEGVFRLSTAEVVETRLGLLRSAVEWHLDRRAPYAAYAARRHFDLAALRQPAGLAHVPLLPSMIFKRAGVAVSHPACRDVLVTTSSGTKGGISQVPRDDVTLRRFFSSIGNLTHEMLTVENPALRVFNLGPSVHEAKNLWIAYVMSGVSAMLPRSKHYVEKDVFLLDEVLCDLRAAEGERVVLIGPPPILFDLAQAMSTRRVRASLAPDSAVVTIGGWKRRAGERVPRDRFDALMTEVFQLSIARVRDTFNMVELNTVLVECEAKRLHVPPWLYARAREPASLDVLPSGRSGVLSYLDPTARSYPGFVLSDDLGTVEENVACPCGRSSDVVAIERRLNTIESRGCALKMDTFRVG
jgi:long-chain-fatty-acid---luciferin-component ligase